MTSDQIAALTTAQLSKLGDGRPACGSRPASALADLNSDHIRALSTDEVGALTTTQVAAINS